MRKQGKMKEKQKLSNCLVSLLLGPNRQFCPLQYICYLQIKMQPRIISLKFKETYKCYKAWQPFSSNMAESHLGKPGKTPHWNSICNPCPRQVEQPSSEKHSYFLSVIPLPFFSILVFYAFLTPQQTFYYHCLNSVLTELLSPFRALFKTLKI